MGLERVSGGSASGHPQACAVRFTVAGTNGKVLTCAGSVIASRRDTVWASMAFASSGTLHTERVRVQGIGGITHTRVCPEIEAARGDISLTYFEYGTLSALWLFKQANLDVVILEVGLGGRTDATNIVDADVAVVPASRLTILTGWGRIAKVSAAKAGVSCGNPLSSANRKCGNHRRMSREETRRAAVAASHGVDWRYGDSDPRAFTVLTARLPDCRCRGFPSRMPPPPRPRCIQQVERIDSRRFATVLRRLPCRDVFKS